MTPDREAAAGLVERKKGYRRSAPPIRIEDGVGIVELTRGHFAKVDIGDISLIEKHVWSTIYCDSGKMYAHTSITTEDGIRHYMQMHRLIMKEQLQERDVVDHINGDGLDNRRRNMRVATQRDNSRNARIRSDNKIGYKGVSFKPTLSLGRQYIARIKANGKEIHLGTFPTPEDAHKAYCAAAEIYHGKFARAS